MFSFLLGMYLRVELLGHTVTMFCLFAKLFSKATVPFYISTRILWGFQSLYIFTSTCYYLFHYNYPGEYEVVHLIVSLTCVFLIANDAEHLFVYLLAFCLSSLETRKFRFFVHFLTLESLSFYWVIVVLYIY